MKGIQFFTIKSSGGLVAEISNLGAKITKLLVANGKGEVKDIVLGFRTADEWRTKEAYFNAICGRVANRIKDGKFTLAEHDEHMPDSVVISVLLVMLEEIRTCGIEDPFRYDPCKSCVGHCFPHRPNHQ